MKVVCQAVIPPLASEEMLHREITEWIREVMFFPIIDLLEDAGVVLGKIGTTSRLNETWSEFPPEMDTLGIPRIQMPQIASKDRDALIRHLAGRYVENVAFECLPGALRPSQSRYSPEKVEAARAHPGANRPILIASDNRIVDGHHQWLATLWHRTTEPIRVIQFQAPLRWVISRLSGFAAVEHHNARTGAILEGLRSGRIWYADGMFSGDFNAAISRELRALGGHIDPKRRVFVMPVDMLPMDVRGALAESSAKSEALHKSIISLAADIGAGIAASPILGIPLRKYVDSTLDDLQKQFVRSVSRPTKGLRIEVVAVKAQVDPDVRAALTSRLSENLQLSIKNFADEQIPELRRLVEENYFAGGRMDKLAGIIEARFGVAERKAAFWARQETTLLSSRYVEERSKDVGSQTYVWQTRHDNLVRHDHAELNGRTFFWDQPPVVDDATGKTANPGEDWNCRCVARPILNFRADELKAA